MNYSKDGITIAAMLDTRRAKTTGEYPVKIRVTKSYKNVEFNKDKTENFERDMTYISEMLPELKINIQSN